MISDKLKNDTRKIAIYSRKSKFTGKGDSVENQITFCKDYLASHFPGTDEADFLIFEDEGFSGATTKRPKLQKLINEVRNNNIKMVICYRLDRISRNVSDFANLKKEFDQYDVEFVSIKDNFDTTTPMGNAMMMIVSVFAQLERDTIAERIRDNMRELAKSGRWLGGITPTGYKSEKIVVGHSSEGKDRIAYKLDIVSEEAEIVKLIYSKFLEFNSLTKTETYLLQNHITTKNGKYYTRFSIKAILENPVYLTADENAWEYFNKLNIEISADKEKFNGKHGVMSYNKTIQKPGKANQKNDYSEWIVAVGKHKPLISSEDWIRVQQQIQQNKPKSFRKPKSHVALLSGVLRCADCGSFMRPKLTKRVNADGEYIYSYLCEMKEKSKSHNCQMINPNGNELDKAVCDFIKTVAEDSSTFNSDLRKSAKDLTFDTSDLEAQIKRDEALFAENSKQIQNLLNSLAYANEITAVYINDKISSLHAENEEIQKRITENKISVENSKEKEFNLEAIEHTLSCLQSSFDTSSVEEKRAAIRMLVDSIVWDGKDIQINLIGANSEPLCEDSK